MRRGLMAVVVIIGTATAAAAQDPPVRRSKCPAMGRGIVVVGDLETPGGSGGTGGPWIVPPRELLPSTTVDAEYLTGRKWVTYDWIPEATGDFDGDGTCDLVWKSVSGAIALTVTDASVSPPVFRRAEDVGVPVEPPPPYWWTLVGSGDFVSTAASDPGAKPAALDGRPDLLFWSAADQTLHVWGSAPGATFPLEHRHAVPVLAGSSKPVVVANIDGEGPPEIIWLDPSTSGLSYSQIVPGEGGPRSAAGGTLDAQHPADRGWELRAADDFDGDGCDDLVWQNLARETAVVWFMKGNRFLYSLPFSPTPLVPPSGAAVPRNADWPIFGPR